jgi:hypothetical protein
VHPSPYFLRSKPQASEQGSHVNRLEAVERLILESQQQYPNNLHAGIEYAMREMHSIIADAEHGNAEAVAEVGLPSKMVMWLVQTAPPACELKPLVRCDVLCQ